MLKSKFNIAVSNEKIEEEAAKTVADEHEAVAEEQETVEEEPAQPTFEKHLKRSEVSIRMSMLGKTADGDGYTYLKAACTDMKLTNIASLTYFKHLQFVDVSKNLLTLNDLQILAELEFLLLIQADHNLLTSGALKRMKYLQVIILNYNKIKSVSDIYQPELSTLEIGFNQIEVLEFLNRMPTMRVLDFRYNQINNIQNLNFPNLDSLYLAGNKITSLEGVDGMPNLRVLHVRNNPIKILDGFEQPLPKLQYLNLRNCKVATLIQVKKLRTLKALEVLIMKGTPFMGGTGEEKADAGPEEEDSEVRVEVLASLPSLKRINKAAISPEERTEAMELLKQWIEEGENDEEEVVEEMGEEIPNINE